MRTTTTCALVTATGLVLGAASCTHDWNALSDEDAGEESSSDDAEAPGAEMDAGGETSADASREAGASAQTDAAAQSDAGSEVPCEAEAQQSGATFASAMGTDTAGCGSAAMPCRSLARAMEQAQAQGAKRVYLGAGTFEAGVDLRAGLTLSGGFDSSWKRDCASPLTTQIQAPAKGSFALRAVDLHGGVRLERLTLLGADAASVQPGQSVFGLIVRGETSQVELDRVDIRVPNAGDGAAGANGGAAMAVSGTCTAPGTGAAGARGKDGSVMAGSFSADGYQPGNGTAGSPGETGQNGTRTLAATATTLNYACQSPCGTGSVVTLPKGTDGQPGCGGRGGLGGGAGLGGGSSIALFVWDGRVHSLGGSFNAGRGGDGGDGGTGSDGTTGSAGKSGTAGMTVTVEPTCCGAPTNKSAPGGSATAGGAGGKGGDGGSGAGGSSYAVYVGGLGSATLDRTSLAFGRAGQGGAGMLPGAPGMAAAKNF